MIPPNSPSTTLWQKFLNSLKKREVAPSARHFGKRVSTHPETLEGRIAPAVLTWVGDVDTNWNTNAVGDTNWDTNTLPASGDTLIFAGAAVGSLNNDTTGGNQYIIQFTAGGYTLAGNSIDLGLAGDDITSTTGTNTIALNLTLSGSNPEVSVSGGTVAISGNLSGGSEFWKDGAGTVVLSGANSHTNSNVIVEGTLEISDFAQLGGGNLYIGQGGSSATIKYTGPTASTSKIGAFSLQAAGTGNTIEVTNAATDLSLTAALGNTVSGNGFTKSGAGSLFLTVDSTHDGPVTVSAGTLLVGNGATAGSLTTSGSAAVTVNGTLAFNRSDSVTLANNVTGSGEIRQVGSGTLNLTGANSYGGGTTVSAGTVHVGNANALGTGAVTLNDAATGASNTALLATGAFTIPNNITVANQGTGTTSIGSTTFVSGTATFFGGTVALNKETTFSGGNSDRTTFTGVISGTPTTVTISGGARTTWEAANTFTGDIAVTGAGTVFQVGHTSGVATNQIPDVSNVDVGAGATFQVAFEDESINNLTGTGTVRSVASNRTLTVGANNGTATFSGSMVNDGANTLGLTKIGTGTQTLSGTGINFGGATTVSNGRLILSEATSHGNGASTTSFSIASGATLEFNVTGTHTVGSTSGADGIVISGGGTLQKTGVGLLALDEQGTNAFKVTVAMASGALIDVQGGAIRNGGWQGQVWTNNRSDLNVAAGATFDIWDGNGVIVDVITGAGTINRGIGGTSAITIGADNGTGTFTGTLANGVGAVGVTKIGTGTQTLSGTGINFGGATTVSNGRLILSDATSHGNGASATSFSIAAGATLEFNVSTQHNLGSTTGADGILISGGGTMVKSGAGLLALDDQGSNLFKVTMALTTGSLIDVQAGAIRNGGWQGQVWTNNKADLNIAAGATFDIWDGNGVIVDALTGAGTLNRGIGGTSTITIGADNGSGTFTGTITDAVGGVALTKSGTGTQALSGANAYSGATTINAGTLLLGSATALGTAAGATTIVSGATLDLNGQTIAESITPAGTGVGALGAIINSNAAAATVSGTISNSGSTVGVAAGNITFSGSVNNNTLTKIGAGTLILSGATDNSSLLLNAAAGTVNLDKAVAAGVRAVAGITDIASGATVRLTGANTDQIFGGSGTGPNSLVNISTGGTLDMNGRSEGFSRLTGTGTVTSGVAGAATLTIGETNGTGTTFSGVIQDGSGTVALTKTGTGTQTLAGANTYTGATTINGNGTLTVGHVTALGGGAGATSIAAGSTLNLNGFSITEAITSAGTGVGALGAIQNTSATAVTVTGTITNSGSTVGVAAGDITFNGSVNGATLTKIGTGTLILSGTTDNNSLVLNAQGGTTILDKTVTGTSRAVAGIADIASGATVRISTAAHGDQIFGGSTAGANSLVNISAGGTLDLNGKSESFSRLTGAGTVTSGVAGTATLTIGEANGTGANFTGVIQNGSGTVALTKIGTGTQTLSGANTYSGVTTISAGILVANNAAALGNPTGATTVAANGQLDLGTGITITGETVTVSGTGSNFGGGLRATGGTGTWAGPVIIGDANTRIGAAATATLNISGGIQGSGANQSIFTTGDAGTGVVLFSAAAGTNTYTGGTNIIRGILRVGAVNSLPVGTTLDVDFSNAAEISSFDLNGFNQTVAALQRTDTGGGTGGSNVTNSGAAATLTVNQTATTTYSGTVTGALALVKANTGTLTLSGANTYTGGTTVSAGTLNVNNATGLGAAAAVSVAGTLVFNAAGTFAHNISGAGAITSAVAGNVVLTGNNPFTGTYTINASSNLIFDSLTALAGSPAVVDNGTLYLGSAYAGASGTISSLSGTGGVNTAFGATVGTRTLIVSQTATTTLSGLVVDGGGGRLTAITKSGTGTLNLTGTNTYSGGTSITGGVLATNVAGVAATSGGLGIGPVSIGASGSLNLTGTAPITYQMGTVTGTGVINFTNIGTGSSTSALNGNLTGFTGTMNIGVGVAAGAGKVSFSAATQIPAAGATINVLSNATLYVTGAITVPSSVTLAGGDTGESLGQLRLDSGSIVSGSVSLTGNITGTNDAFVGSNAGTGTISGIVSETGGARTLSKVGGGIVQLSGANTYTGGTALVGGVLQANNNSALGTGTVTFPNATTGRLQVGAGGGAITLANPISMLGTVTPGGGVGAIFATGNDGTLTGAINIVGAATSGGHIAGPAVAGANWLSINSAITVNAGVILSLRDGNIQVSGGGSASTITYAGNLRLGANDGLPTNAIVDVSYGGTTGTFNLNGFNQTVAGLSRSGTNTTTVTNTSGTLSTLTLNDTGTRTYPGVLAGNLAIDKTNTGIWTLSGANTFTGNATVSGGTLRGAVNGALGTIAGKTIVASGATFDINGNRDYGQEPFEIAGTGVGGLGAIINSGAAAQQALEQVKLTANATVGGTNRFDIRVGTGAATLDLNGFTLTKIGTAHIPVVGGTITDGSIVINAGTFGVETTSSAITGTGNVTVNNGGTLGFWGLTGSFSRPIVMNAGGIISDVGGPLSTVASDITLAGAGTITTTGAVGTGIVLNGIISDGGTGIGFTKTGAATLKLAGNNTYSGTTTNSAGFLQIGNAGASGNAGTGPIVNNATLHFLRSDASSFGNTVTGTGTMRQLDTSGQVTITGSVTQANVLASSGSTAIIAAANPLILGPTSVLNISGNLGGADNVTGAGLFGKIVSQAGATVNTVFLNLGEESGRTGEFQQDGGTITVSSQMRIGHWPGNTSTYTMNGGTLTLTGTSGTNPFGGGEQNGAIYLGVDGTGVMAINGGTVSAQGVVLDNRGATVGTDSLTVTGGTLNVGQWGIQGQDASTVNFGGGTLRATANWDNSLTYMPVNFSATTTVDTNGFDVPLNNTIAGAGDITKINGGTLTISGTASAFTGGLTLNGGTTLVNTNVSSAGGAVAVASGATLGGTGTLNRNVTVAGNITGGTDGTVGTLTIADLVFNGGTYKADIIGAVADKVVITSTVNLDGGTAGAFALNNAASGVAPGTVFTLIEVPGVAAIPGVPLTGATQGAAIVVDGQNAIYTYLSGVNANDFALVVDGATSYTGTAGDDTFEIRRVNLAGDDVVQILLGGTIIDSRPVSVGTVIINGTDGDDTVFVNYGASGGVHNFNTVFNGGNQTIGDSLSIGGASVTTVTHTFVNNNDGSITVVDGAGTRTVTYTGLEPIVDNLDAVNRVFEFSGSTETITLTDAGAGTMTIDSNVGGESVTFANATTSLTINSGAGDDTITLTTISATYAGSLTVNGGDDIDTINIAPGLPTLSSAAFTAETINAVTLTTTGNQSYTGAVLLSGATTLTSNTGGITTAGSVDGAQTLSLSAVAGNIDLSAAIVGGVTPLTSLTTSSATIAALPAVTAGALTIMATAGGVSGASSVVISGATGVTAAGAITLNGAGNDFQGSVTLNATVAGAITVTDSAGGLNVPSAATTDGAISLSATGGNLTATSVAAGTAGAVNLTTLASGDVLVDNGSTAGDITINSAGAIDEAGGDAAADLTASSLSLSAATGIGAAGIIETAVSIITGSTFTGGIDLANTGALAITSLAASTSGNITLTNTGSIALGGNVTAASGNVALTTTANITRSAGTVGGTAVTFSATAGTIGASGAEVNTAATTLVVTSSGDQFITEVDGADITSTATGGNITLTTTTGDWTLVSTGVDATGTVTIAASAGDILRSGVAADVTGTTLTLSAGGADGDLGVSGNELLTTGMAIAFGGAGTGDVFITETDGATLTGTNDSGNATLTTTTGDWTINSTGVDAIGNVTLIASLGDILRSGATADVTGNTLTFTAGGADGDLGATGNELLTGGASIVFTGTLTGDVFITEANGANVTGSTGSGSITLITTTGNWNVVGTGVSTSSDVVMTASAGDLLRASGVATAVVAGNNVTLTAGGLNGDIGLNSLPTNRFRTNATNLVLTGTGTGAVNITELTGATVTGSTGSGNIFLTTVAGDWTVVGSGLTTTGDQNITVLSGDILRSGAGAIIAGAALTLFAGGADGDIGAAGNALLTTVNSMVFTGSTTGEVVITETDGASVNGSTGSGDINIASTTGAIAFDGDVSTTGDVTILAATGNIVRIAGTVIGDDLSFTASGTIGASGLPIRITGNTITTLSGGDQFFIETDSIAASLLAAGAGNISLVLSSGTLNDNNGALNNFAGTDLILVAPGGIAGVETAVQTLTATTTNSDILINEFDNVALNLISAGSGDVTLAAGGAITDNNGALSNINADALTITSGSGIDIDTTVNTLVNGQVSTLGNLRIDDLAGGLNVTTVTTADGDITITAAGGNLNVIFANASNALTLTTTVAGDVRVGDVNAGVTVSINAFAALNELAPNDAGADITADNAVLNAGTGIGTNSGGALETALTGALDAATNTGGVFIDNTGIFSIGNVTVATSGNIVINGDAEITIDGTVNTADDITIHAVEFNDGLGPYTNNLTVNGTVGSAATNNVTLRAGDDLTIAPTGVVNGSTSIEVCAGYNDLDTRGELGLDGTINLSPGGVLTLCAAGDIVFGPPAVPGNPVINAPGSPVTLTTLNGNIYDNNDNAKPATSPVAPGFVIDVVASVLTMNAPNGFIGEAIDTIETTINAITANAGSGGLFLWNTAALTVAAVTTAGATTTAVDITSEGSMTISGPVTDSDTEAMNFFAAGAAANLTLNGTVTGAGDMTFQAGNLVNIGALGVINNTGTETITLDAGWPDGISGLANNVLADLTISGALNLAAASLRLTAPRHVVLSGGSADITTTGSFTVVADRDSLPGVGIGGTFRQTDLDSTVQVSSVDISAADVELVGTIDAGTGDISVIASRSASPIYMNNTGVGLNLSLTDLLSLRTVGGTVTIGDTGNLGTAFIGALGTVGLGLIDANYTINGGAIDFNGGIVLADNRTLTLNATSSGLISTTGGGTTDVVISGATGTLIVNSSGNVTLNTRVANLGESSINGDLVLNNTNTSLTVVGDVDALAADITVGTGTFGVVAPFAVATDGSASGNLTITADGMELDGTLEGGGVLTLRGNTVATTFGFGNASTGMFNMEYDEIVNILNGFDQIVIGRAGQTGNMHFVGGVGTEVTFSDPVQIVGGTGEIKIEETSLAGTGGASFDIDARRLVFTGTAPGVVTDDEFININAGVVLESNTTIDSTAAGAGGGADGDVTFIGTINGAFDLTVTADGGDILFAGNPTPVPSGTSIGGEARLTSITASGAKVTLHCNIHTSGDQTYTGTEIVMSNGDRLSGAGNLTFNGPTTVTRALRATALMGSITFNGDLNSGPAGTGALTLTAGAVSFLGDVGDIEPLAALNVTVTGALTVGGDFTTEDLIVELNEIDFLGGAGSVTIPGVLEVKVKDIGTAFRVGGLETDLVGIAPTLNFSDADIAALADGITAINLIQIGTASLMVVAETGDVTFLDPLTLRHNGKAGEIQIKGNLYGDTANGSITTKLAVTGATVLEGSVFAPDGGNIDIFNGRVASNVSLDSSMGGGDVIIRGKWAAAAGGETLDVLSGAGDISIIGTLGIAAARPPVLGAVTLTSGGNTTFGTSLNAESLVVNGGGITKLGGSVITTGAAGQLYSNVVELAKSAGLTSKNANGSIIFASTIDSIAPKLNSLTITNRDALAGTTVVDITGDVGASARLGTFRINTKGDAVVGGDIFAKGVAITAAEFSVENVDTVIADTIVNAQTYRGVGSFNGTINSERLTINTTGDLANSAAWTVSGLATINTDKASDINLTNIGPANVFGELSSYAENISIQSSGSTTLKSIRAFDSFDIDTTGSVTVRAVRAVDSVTINSGGSILQTGGLRAVELIATAAASIQLDSVANYIQNINSATAGTSLSIVSASAGQIGLSGTITAGGGDMLLAATRASFIYAGGTNLVVGGGFNWTMYTTYVRTPSFDLELQFGPDATELGEYPDSPIAVGDVIVYRIVS